MYHFRSLSSNVKQTVNKSLSVSEKKTSIRRTVKQKPKEQNNAQKITLVAIETCSPRENAENLVDLCSPRKTRSSTAKHIAQTKLVQVGNAIDNPGKIRSASKNQQKYVDVGNTPKSTTVTSREVKTRNDLNDITSEERPNLTENEHFPNEDQIDVNVFDITNITRFNNNMGNNNCWLNCVIRVLAHMLNLCPEVEQSSSDPMIHSFLQYLKDIMMMKGDTLWQHKINKY